MNAIPDPIAFDAWEHALNDALPSANLPTLLMVLVHLTGDTRWLGPRYRCSRIKGLDDHDRGGLPDEVAAEIVDAARQALLVWRQGLGPALEAPSAELLETMMRASIGEELPDGYGPILAASLGFDPDFALDQRAAFDVPEGFKVAIVGAGVAGLCAAIRLAGAGIPYVVIEKNTEVGGTWHENRYPGAGVDTPSHIYSFSFAKHDWSMHFALQSEIQGYFDKVADEWDVRPRIRFGTRLTSARYDEAAMRWELVVVNAEGVADTLVADILISAVGYLNVPKSPSLEGLASFAGAAFHTARWPRDFDPAGRKIAVIGNGASAMQVVPAIADQVDRLTIFQRSKQWAAPFEKFHQPISDAARFLLRAVPYYQEWYRQRLAWIFNDRVHASLQIDPGWPHPQRAINATNDRHREFFTDYIKAELGDRQDLLEAILPDYPPFGKRMLMDNGWFRTVTAPHVTLVSDRIARVVPDGVVTEDGSHFEADTLIFATGFDALEMLSSFDLKGRAGRSIRDAWSARGAEAFMGMTVPGFPNFFVLSGPNTGLGHGGSVVALIESQVTYVLSVLRQAFDASAGRFEIEVRTTTHDAFNEEVEAAHRRMIWTHPGMSNWYRNAQGRVVATTPFRNDTNWHLARAADLNAFVLRPAATSSTSVTRGDDRAAAQEMR